jgi:indolepyruvate ferredoxin oxidoreductase beta subunit
VLPFPPPAFEAAIVRGGVGVKESLLAFRRGFERSQAPSAATEPAVPPVAASAATQAGAAVLERIRDRFPAPLALVLTHGVRRLSDYQDLSYAETYLDRVSDMLIADRRAGGEARDFRLTAEAARGLALWMSYEDTIRVADLKTRASRFARVRTEVRAAPEQLVHTSEFLHPRLQEVCDTLPETLGEWISRTPWAAGVLTRFFSRGRSLHTYKVTGFMTLYLLASLRPLRRSSLRFRRETQSMLAWLSQVERAAALDYDLAVELAACQNLVKGYGETHARGMRSFTAIMEEASQGASSHRVARLRQAALSDEAGEALRTELAFDSNPRRSRTKAKRARPMPIDAALICASDAMR